MTLVKSTVKGQILIPADLRKKFGIVKGTTVNVYEKGNKIIVEPVREDIVQSGRGLLNTKGRVLKALTESRKEEGKL